MLRNGYSGQIVCRSSRRYMHAETWGKTLDAVVHAKLGSGRVGSHLPHPAAVGRAISPLCEDAYPQWIILTSSVDNEY
jgi:hypothetical protein